MRNFSAILALFTVVAGPAFAVSMNFGGNLRSQSALYSGLDLGSGASPQTKTFIETRALVEPNLVIDDHFTVHSQWNLITSPRFTPNATIPLGVGQGGWVMGDTSTSNFIVTRAWLEWTSDFGVFRLGRMPISWGYGLVYDAGDEIWDNWQTDMDRIEYRLHLGHLVGAIAYSKPRKLSTLGQSDDSDFYTAYIQYDNPEMEMEAGVMYEKQVRSTTAASEYSGGVPPFGPSPNPYNVPANISNPPSLSGQIAYPLSDNFIDLYLKKTMGDFSFGGEIGWLSGTATSGDLNAFGLTANATYDFHKVKAYVDFLYASGDSNFSNHLNGFVVLNRNRSPGLILGNQLLGPYASDLVGYGSLVYYGDPGDFSGILYLRPGVRIDWSTAWASGLELIIPRKATTASDASSLGVEVDANVTHTVYKNFDIGLDLGYLFAGDGLRVSNPKGVFATRATVALKF